MRANFKRIFQIKWPGWLQVLVNIALLALIVVTNNFNQFFCLPSTWFAGYLILFAVCFSLYPFLNKLPVLQKTALVISTSFVWVVLFALFFSIYGLASDSIGLIGMILFSIFMFTAPAIVLFIVFKRIQANKIQLLYRSTLIFHGLLIVLFVIMLAKYTHFSHKVNATTSTEVLTAIKNSSIINAWMLEKMLGLHFKYHTRLCVWDGWRPPILDPVASMGFMLTKGPFSSLSLHEKILLYKQVFPENPVVQDCKCPGAPNNYYMDLEKYK